MSTDLDRELRRLARALVADDDPAPIPQWPLDDAAEVGGSGHGGRHRLWAVAAAVILIVGAIAVLASVRRGEHAGPADAPTTTALPATVAPSTTVPTSTAVPPTAASPTTDVTTTPTVIRSPTPPPPTALPEVSTTEVTTAPTSCGEPGRDDEYPLQRCDAGLAVAVLKGELIAKGYLPAAATATSSFDDQVEAAVRAFQSDHGLEVDGLVGPITWAAITADYQRAVVDPNGDGRLDPAEIGTIGDANEP